MEPQEPLEAERLPVNRDGALRAFKRNWATILLQALVYAIVVIAIATGVSALTGQTQLARRIDTNADIARRELERHRYVTDCLLTHRPEDRDADVLRECLSEAEQLDLDRSVEQQLIENHPRLRVKP